jgi:LacI family transcriptional regulator
MPQIRRVLVLADAAHGYDRQVLAGIGHYARYIKGWHFRSYAPWEEARIARVLSEWKPDGVITCDRVWKQDVFEAVTGQGAAMVQVDAVGLQPPIPSVYTDNRAVAQIALDYLIGRGIKSLAFVGSPSAQDLAQAQVMRAMVSEQSLEFAVYNGEIRRESDPACTFRDWLSKLSRRTGILAANDWFGLHIISECLDAGYRLPDDLAIVGVGNDQPWCELAAVPLSSVEVAAEKIGYRAADLLDRVFRGETLDMTPVLIAPVGIVSRLSSDMIAAEDPDMALVLRYLHDHAGEGCSIKDVLRTIPVDRRRMERWFRDNLGRSPLQELHRIRIAMVKKLLAETDEPMQSVARRCGFGSAKLMSRMFSRETGTLLSQYRRQFLISGERGKITDE